MMEPDYKVETMMFDLLWVTFSVKSKFRWQLPLKENLRVCRDSCIEEVIELVFRKKNEVHRLPMCIEVVSDGLVLREETVFEAGVVKQRGRLLPMGAFTGVKLSSMTALARATDAMRVPAHIFFGVAREDITKEKISIMKHTHLDRIHWAQGFTSGILNEIDSFLEEVLEDMKMTSSLESLMPFPPHMSHLFLKHCEGRELQEDAVTPRAEEAVESSSEEEPHEDFLLDRSQSKEAELQAAREERKSFDHNKKRIEKNRVLLQQTPKDTKAKQHRR